ncbi:MAG: FimV/HubP family polar landmark protein [Pseudohongiellaceae bacterium]
MLARLLSLSFGSCSASRAAGATHARLLAACLLIAGSLAAAPLAAQGLGELTVESALDEPLRASIQLLDTGGLDADQLLIAIASPEEYEQAGLERNGLLARIEFDVQLEPQGSSRVILTSQDRISEPALSLLVSAQWPSGRVLRDYTLLLEPTDEAPAAATRAGATAPTTEPAAAGTSYIVRSGDSLWKIAEQTRPGTDVALPQMIIALQRANEDAFVNNNINRLISGRVLRIPTRDEIAIIAPAVALAQINAQNQEAGLTPLGGAAATAEAERDQLSVLGTEDAAGAGADTSDLGATIAALEAELLLSEEDLDRARIENEELNARLVELEEQIAILQNIIAIEDERIAQLQNELATQAEAPGAAGPGTDLVAAGEGQASQSLLGSSLALLQSNVVFIGAGLAVLLAVLGALVLRARRVADEEVDFNAVAPAPAAAAAAGDEDEGVLARLLARLRRRGDEDEYAGGASGVKDADARADAQLPEIEVDEIADELTGGLFADDEFEPAPVARAATAPMPVVAEVESKEAAVLANSILDEEASALREIDESLLDAPRATAPVASASVDFAQAEVGIDRAEPQPVVAVPQASDFRVIPAATPAVAARPTGDATEAPQDPEPFAFRPDPAPIAAASAAPAKPAAEPEIETVEVKSVAGGLDLGSLSFDEDDARQADETESSYNSRSSMDDCDTKLDLAVAYEAMGDVDGAIEILEEVIVEGKPAQVDEAQRLKAKWQYG